MLVGKVYKIISVFDDRVFWVRVEGIREGDDWCFDRAYYGVVVAPVTWSNHAITILVDQWNYKELSSLEAALI